MQKWFSALDDAIIQRQWQANPSGAVGGVRGCALHLGVDRNAAPAPRRTARHPGRERCWRQTSSIGCGASAGPGGAGSASAPPPSQVPREDEWAPPASPRRFANHTELTGPRTSLLRAGSLCAGSPSAPTLPRPPSSRDMSRKRQRLVPETLGLKRRRALGPTEADPLRGEAGSARAAVAELVRLFPRGLFEDALPPIALRSQVYSLVPDRTAADRQLKALQEQGEIRVIQLGFDLDAHGIIFTEDYRTRVLKVCDGRSYAGAVQKFLASVLPACGDLSFQQDQMTQTFGFRDTEITQLVNAGVLTVRDAGSWWLAVPGAGRFIKCFVKGRQAVLGMVRKAKYRELLLSELLGRRPPAAVRLGLAYHVHDLIGAQLVDCVSTTSGTLLRLPET